MLLTYADYYGIINYFGSDYLVAKVVEDEANYKTEISLKDNTFTINNKEIKNPKTNNNLTIVIFLFGLILSLVILGKFNNKQKD